MNLAGLIFLSLSSFNAAGMGPHLQQLKELNKFQKNGSELANVFASQFNCRYFKITKYSSNQIRELTHAIHSPIESFIFSDDFLP